MAGLDSQIKAFCQNNSMAGLYRAYAWGNDSWSSGFVDIFSLEKQLSAHDRGEGIALDDVKDVARWGKLRNSQRIRGAETVLPPHTFKERLNGCPSQDRSRLSPLEALQSTISSGIGPTYYTKILRFAASQAYGALDTRCVRVFGQGDPENQQQDWLKIYARNYSYGWFIPKTQTLWPAGYLQWLRVLDLFCLELPADCPHPRRFVEAGLRNQGVWSCADVEMALFTFASRVLNR